MNTTTAPLDMLPNTGRYTVHTEHSTYTIDLDEKTFNRVNTLGNNPRWHDGQPEPYDHLECDLDASLVIKVSKTQRWMQSTRVTNIEPAA